MITLYVKDNCRHSERVLVSLKKNGVPYVVKNISDPAVATELIRLGGERRVPFLKDSDPCATAGHHTPCMVDGDVAMYESWDIIHYIDENYGGNTKK